MSVSSEPYSDRLLEHNAPHYSWADYSLPPLQPSTGYWNRDLAPLQTYYASGLSAGLNGQPGGSESGGSQSGGSDYSYSQNVQASASVLPPAPVSTQRQHSLSDPPAPQFFPSDSGVMPICGQPCTTSFPRSPNGPNTYHMPETSQFPPSDQLPLSLEESSVILESLFPQQEPPAVTSNNEFLVHILSSRPRPQCWSHGCNGREFSSMSNLLRHQRERSGAVTKAECPVCGAVFTRTTARNIHVFERCEGRGRSLQSQRRQHQEWPRELESDYLVSRGLEDPISGLCMSQEPMLLALFNDGTGSRV